MSQRTSAANLNQPLSDGEIAELDEFLNFKSIMEGSGCQCDQKSCYVRLRLNIDVQGNIMGVELA